MTDNPYPVGATVLAKLKGYPWWPARIESDQDLPANVASKKPKQRPIWPVFFFGSYDYGWFAASELKAFDPVSAAKAMSDMRKANLQKTAYAEALDPNFTVGRTDGSEPEEEEDEDEEIVAPVTKKTSPKTKKASKASKASKAEPAGKKRRASESEDHPVKRRTSKGAVVASSEDGEDLELPKPTKRAVATSQAKVTSEKRTANDEISAHETSNGQTRKSDEDAGDSGEGRAKKKLKSGQPNERLLKLRHKLQKLLLVEGLSDEALVQNLERADPILAEVEAFEIDLQMLKDTKIGRLMKKISALQFSQDPHHIVERSIKLIKQYKIMMEKAQENGEGIGSTAKAAEATGPIKTTVSFTNFKNGDSESAVLSAAKSQSPIVPTHILDVPPIPEAVVAAVAAIVETDTLPLNISSTEGIAELGPAVDSSQV
ncbi:hypothetical protein BGZ67_006784 [Mortierella alpina]|nr:hypothetical protein BGZ67_006784 [Mortierella alpina]